VLPERGAGCSIIDDHGQLEVQVKAAHVDVHRSEQGNLVIHQNQFRVQQAAAIPGHAHAGAQQFPVG
jgi:hypothetical protein